MSIDTTVVIACSRMSGCARYTAAVVQAAENLLCDDVEHSLRIAMSCFFLPGTPWFSTIGRAKQFASLISEETVVEYPERLIVEIAWDGIHRLTQKGRRMR